MRNDMTETTSARIITRITIGFAVFAGTLFGSAGTWKWPGAWAYLIVHFSFAGIGAYWLKKHDPGLLERRMTFMKGATKGWDKAFVITATVLFIPLLVLPGLDAERHQWSFVSLPVKLVAFSGLLAAAVLISWVMRVNTFASRLVEIQRDRGHRVITTGPYRFVRHPMYVGVLVYLFCLPLALGSLWTLVVSSLLTVLFLIRTVLEDKTLHEELEGYRDYAAQVRYKLVPGIW